MQSQGEANSASIAEFGALSLNTTVFASGVSIELMRGHKLDEVTTERGRYISEPAQDGRTTAKITINFSRYATNNIARFLENLTKAEKKASLIFSGPVANGATSYELAWSPEPAMSMVSILPRAA